VFGRKRRGNAGPGSAAEDRGTPIVENRFLLAVTWPDREQDLRALGLGSLLGAEAKRVGQRGRAHAVDDPGAPTAERGGDVQTRKQVACVVLHVAHGALAVLPRFAPSDSADRGEKRAVGSTLEQRRTLRSGQHAAALERVLARVVMLHGRRRIEPRGWRQHEVHLAGVQVARTRRDPQEPTGIAIALLRGQRARVEEETRERFELQLSGGHEHSLRGIEQRPITRGGTAVRSRFAAGIERRLGVACEQRARRAGPAPEGRGLVVPIESHGPGGITPKSVARAAVVGHQRALRGLTRIHGRSPIAGSLPIAAAK